MTRIETIRQKVEAKTRENFKKMFGNDVLGEFFESIMKGIFNRLFAYNISDYPENDLANACNVFYNLAISSPKHMEVVTRIIRTMPDKPEINVIEDFTYEESCDYMARTLMLITDLTMKERPI